MSYRRLTYLLITIICVLLTALIIVSANSQVSEVTPPEFEEADSAGDFFKRLFNIDGVQGDCVPRAFFNATSWAIHKHSKVLIADFKGHWQGVGLHEGEYHFLNGEGWYVDPGKKEGDKPIKKLWNLRDAMEHFIKHNPWCIPSDEEMKQLQDRVDRMPK